MKIFRSGNYLKFTVRTTTILALVAVLMLSVSCNDSQRENDDTTVASTDMVRAMKLYNEAFLSIHEILINDTLLSTDDTLYLPREEDTLMLTQNSTFGYPREILINYGEDLKITERDYPKKGRLRVWLYAPYDSTLSMRVSFDFHQIGNYELLGEMDINTADSTSQTEGILRELTDARILRLGQGIKTQKMYFNFSDTLKFTTGNFTPYLAEDDGFSGSGSYGGISFRGQQFSSQFNEDWMITYTCKNQMQGKAALNAPNIATREINFSRSCSSSFSVAFYNTTETIKFPL
jgi:hypothetical protein